MLQGDRKRLITIVGVLICLVIALGRADTAAQGQEPTQIRLSHQITALDTTLVLPLEIDCGALSGCAAFSLEIRFDPVIIQVDQVDLGPYLGDSVFEAENRIDQVAGTIRLAATALGDVQPPTSGELATISLTGIQPGVSPLEVIEIEIGDLQGQPVAAETIDGRVVVVEEGPLTAMVDLPTSAGFQCYAEPSDTARDVGFVPGGAEVSILGRASQSETTDVDNTAEWLLIEFGREGDPIGPCWTATQALLVTLGDEPFEVQSVVAVLPVATDAVEENEHNDSGSINLPACVVRAERRGVQIRVGPGTNRAVRSSLRVGEDVPVVGQFTDDEGNRWLKIQPQDFNEYEADRYWVAEADVLTAGACDIVAEAEPSRFVFAPPTAAPTTAPRVMVPPAAPEFSAPAPGAPQESNPVPSQPQPAQQPSAPSGPSAPSQPSQPDPAEPDPPTPEPECYSVSVRQEGGTNGGINIVPGPNCEGGRYIAGTVITVSPWGDTETIEGCGVTTIHWDTEAPFAAQVSITADCSIYVWVLD